MALIAKGEEMMCSQGELAGRRGAPSPEANRFELHKHGGEMETDETFVCYSNRTSDRSSCTYTSRHLP
jgi:hypothetical protein